MTITEVEATGELSRPLHRMLVTSTPRLACKNTEIMLSQMGLDFPVLNPQPGTRMLS